ncbi:unnamed protein product [Effrenium voratum]|nr:unnamed protein product [Effrenium voratum]
MALMEAALPCSVRSLGRAEARPYQAGIFAHEPAQIRPLAARPERCFAAFAVAASSWAQRRPKVRRQAEDEEAAAQLAALEAELEALEDVAEDEIMKKADEDEAATLEKINKRFETARPGLNSEVTAGRGAESLGVEGRVAVCGCGETLQLLVERLKKEASENQQPVILDLEEVSRMKFEDLDEALKDCTAAVVCPDPQQASEAALERAKLGLRAVLGSCPEQLRKVVLLSHVGAQEGKGGFNLGAFFSQSEGPSWSSIEDELTSTARSRSASKALYHVIVRVGDPSPDHRRGKVRCVPADESIEGFTSPETAAEAILQVFNRSVNTSFAVVEEDGDEQADWGELLLPFVGPELWRLEVKSVTRTVLFLQQWSDEFFGPGKSALKHGVKTPVQFERTPSGVLFKFRPLTEKDESFENLEEGGIEFVVEEPESCPARVRARRCCYGWKVVPKENSERALLEKFQRDWKEVEQ